MSNNIPMNLSNYDKVVLKSRNNQNLHNNLITFNNAFNTNLGDYTDFIEISGCETPIYMVLRTDYVTFVCRSKVLRSYIFCVLVNYLFDSEFKFKNLVEKYHFDLFLTPSRILALQNLVNLIENLPRDYLVEHIDVGRYRFDENATYSPYMLASVNKD